MFIAELRTSKQELKLGQERKVKLVKKEQKNRKAERENAIRTQKWGVGNGDKKINFLLVFLFLLYELSTSLYSRVSVHS